eukprot:TRINITY_DN15634_c0_g1_i1.p1 TRINITY_DN15634_c0_g1~~TRINITY_DN15634_c0_g1_i1.p1  ORF type:complete len:720 (-),score=173.81 TRINITY_DN15634_c0_g1_i1:306-2465(-)
MLRYTAQRALRALAPGHGMTANVRSALTRPSQPFTRQLGVLSSYDLHHGSSIQGHNAHIGRFTPLGNDIMGQHFVRSLQTLQFKSTRREMGILKSLQKRADNEPDNADAQETFLEELIKVAPGGVIQRFESGRFAENEAIRNLYRRAMVDVAMRTNMDLVDDAAVGARATTSNNHSNMMMMDAQAGSTGGNGKSGVYTAVVSALSRIVSASFIIVLSLGALMTFGGMVENDGEKLPGANKNSTRSWAGAFGKGNHKPQTSNKKFADVIGIDEAVEEVREIVDYLSNPEQYTRLGGTFPKGLLLSGRPGCGKTLLAKAIAGEAGVPLFYASGSEFEEVFVGLGAKRIRELFSAAHANAPCLVFIDEIDAVGGKRNQPQSRDRATLNELLVQLDGFIENQGVIVIAATNLPNMLDEALVRPGRFDRRIHVSPPDVRGRIKLYEHYLADNVEDNVDLEALARLSPGANGADIFNIVNTAAILAAKEGHDKITQEDLDYAKDRIIMGLEKKTHVMSPSSLKITAHHEAGHALITMLNNAAEGVYKATIIPRGPALGMVVPLPSKDESSMTKKQLLAQLDICMGGRVAEELFFGEENVTTGASSDLQKAYKTARAIVMHYGMSDSIGPQFLGDLRDEEMSPQLRQQIDDECKKILDASYERAKKLIQDNKDTLVSVAEALLQYETLTGGQLQDIIDGVPMREVPNPTQGKEERIQARKELYGEA